MARRSLIIERRQTWGVIRYNTLSHNFSYSEIESQSSDPYPNDPVVLNIVITQKCNMDCRYCVAKDFAGVEEDLVVSAKMLEWINHSPYMLLVLTGGEPLMPPYEDITIRLIDSVRDRGIMIDTNGTLLPSFDTLLRLKKHRVMLRVSMDSAKPAEETHLRYVRKGQPQKSLSAYYAKLENIDRFIAAGVSTSIQTVVWRKNSVGLYQMIDWLRSKGIKKWYLQRLIPSYMYKTPSIRFALKPGEYYPLVTDIASKAEKAGIQCIPKMDLRHNSVFLLTANGALYTQGPSPGQKVRLGNIREDIKYFDYVSAADHACRYYLANSTEEHER